MVTRLLHTITDFSSSRRGKFVVIALWLLLAMGLKMLAPDITKLYDDSASQRIPTDADSQVAQKLLYQEFPATPGTPAIIVFYDPQQLSVTDRILIRQFNDWLASDQKPAAAGAVVSPFTVPQATGQLVSQDNTTMTVIVLLTGATTNKSFTDGVKSIRQFLQKLTAATSLQANLTGPAGIVIDLTTVFGSVDLPLLLTTIGLVFVLLILLYRSPLLALLPLVAVGIANLVVSGVLGFSARAGLSIAQMSSSIATVLLFGAGTDYTIFIVSRFREELERTQEKHVAMRQTMRAVGEAIASSAGTVILAMCTLFFAVLGLYTSLGPALAITLAVMLLAGLTLVPALLVCLGRSAYWPFRPRVRPVPEASSLPIPAGFWGRLGAWTVNHRRLSVIGSTALLVLFALGMIGSQPSLNFLASFRTSTESTRGYATLQQHFPAGTLAPTTVLLHLQGTTPDAYQHLTQIDAVNAALQNVPGVATVQGPTRPLGAPPTIDPALLQADIAALPASLREAIRTGQPQACTASSCAPTTPQQAAIIGAYAASTQDISRDGTTVQFSLSFQDDPYGLAAIQRIPLLRDVLSKVLASQGLGPGTATRATFHLAGQTSLLSDTLASNQRDLFVIVPGVLVLVFLILALLLRSLVAPLYLLGAVTLNFLAAIGVCSFFFERVQGLDGFNYAIPLYTFIFLVALGVDYTIFLMSRVREEAHRHGLEAGVPFAVARTGGVITSAGLILAGTFLVLTTLPLTILYQLGVCVAVGILLDTFVVRSLLIPGLVLLLGQWNWWPGRIEARTGTASDSAAVPLDKNPVHVQHTGREE